MRLELMLDNGEVQTPINSENITIELDYRAKGPNSKGTITITNFDFAQESAKVVNDDRASALTGGRSVYEGTPLLLTLVSGTKRLILIDGFVDKTSNQTIYSCERVKAQIKHAGTKEWIEEGREDGFDFELLFEKGLITRKDFIYMPKVVSSIPDNDKISLLLIAELSAIMQLVQMVRDGAYLIAEIAGVFTTIPALAKTGLFIVFIGVQVVIITRTFKSLLSATIQPVKFEACMLLKTLAEKGAEYLGIDFESTKFDDPFWAATVYMPPKAGAITQGFTTASSILSFLIGATSPNNPEQKGFFEGVYGDYLFLLRQLWNGETIVSDGILRIERRDFRNQPPKVILPDIEVKPLGDNAGEIIAQRIIRFKVDGLEQNTTQNYKGTIANIATEIESIGNPLNVKLPGFDRMVINASLATEKTSFTRPETFFIKVFRAISLIVRLLGLPFPNLAERLQERIGMLLTSGDSTGVGKVFAITRGATSFTNKIHPDNRRRLSAKGIYLESYQIESFVTSPSNPNANQFEFKDYPPFLFCFDDIKSVLTNPFIFAPDGETEVQIETAKILAHSGEVTQLTIAENKAFDNTLFETITETDGK